MHMMSVLNVYSFVTYMPNSNFDEKIYANVPKRMYFTIKFEI